LLKHKRIAAAIMPEIAAEAPIIGAAIADQMRESGRGASWTSTSTATIGKRGGRHVEHRLGGRGTLRHRGMVLRRRT